MHTLTLFGLDPLSPDTGKDYTFPGAWTECTVAQLATIAVLTSAPRPPAGDAAALERAEAHLRIALLRELTGMPVRAFLRIDAADLLTVVVDDIGAERVALLPQLTWCLEPPHFRTSLLPEVAVRKGLQRYRFQGPTDQLGRFSISQWGFCDALLTAYQRNPSELAMHNLLGALYHLHATPWCSKDIEQRGALLAHLDDRTKLAAILNYQGLRAALPAAYRRAFKGGSSDPYGMQGMVVRMAGEKFGNTTATAQANIHEVLIHVEQSIDDAEKLKQHNGKQ